MKIIPAIIPQTKEHLLSSLEAIRDVTRAVQIDIVDGIYAGKASWPFAEKTPREEWEAVLRNVAQDFAIEIDCMCERPEDFMDSFALAAERLVIHWGSTTVLDDMLVRRDGRVEMGIALTNDIPLEEVYPYMERIDFVQCMGIAEVGAQGNGFDARVLPRIAEIHEKYPTLEIAVDGHVTMFTLPLLKAAGATRFMAGSSIFATPDPAESLRALQALADA